jgi:predicted RNase H-like nuclease (RuvC/YqgF family)
LSKIGIQTLSIDLIKFINHFNLDFNIQRLEKYLISKESKEWALTNVENFNKHLENFEKHLLEVIELNKPIVDSYYSKLNEIQNLETQKKIRYKKLKEIENEIELLQIKINEVKKEIDY